MTRRFLSALFLCVSLLDAQSARSYFPPRGKWERKAPAELGLDAAKLQQAIDYAQANGSTWDFDKDQVRTFGAVLGPLPKQRAATNGIILRHGYIVAEFGDIEVERSGLQRREELPLARSRSRRGPRLDQDVNDPGRELHPRRRLRFAAQRQDHLEEPPAAGERVGRHACGARTPTSWARSSSAAAQRKPREIQEPGDVLRIQRRADQSLLAFAAAAVRQGAAGRAEDGVMDPIGASHDWRWMPL